MVYNEKQLYISKFRKRNFVEDNFTGISMPIIYLNCRLKLTSIHSPRGGIPHIFYNVSYLTSKYMYYKNQAISLNNRDLYVLYIYVCTFYTHL